MANELDFNAIKKNLQQYKDNKNNEVEQFKKLIDDYINNNEDALFEKLQEAFNAAALERGTTTVEVTVIFKDKFDTSAPNTCKITFDHNIFVKEFTDCIIDWKKEEECALYIIEKLSNKLRTIPYISKDSKKITKPNIINFDNATQYSFRISLDIARL